MKIPKSKQKLEQFIRDVMMGLQDEYSLAFPTSAQVTSHLLKRGYKISLNDRERIKEMREIVKDDVNDWRFI